MIKIKFVRKRREIYPAFRRDKEKRRGKNKKTKRAMLIRI